KKAGPKGKEIQAKIENIKKAIAGLEAQNTQAANTLKLAGKTEPKKVEPKKVEPKKAEPKTQSLNVLQAQLAALKATRAEYRKKLATGPEDAKEIKAKVETLNEKINATLAAINRASITPDVKTKKSKTAKAKAKAAAKPVAPTTPKKDLDLVDIQAKINKIKDQIVAAKAKFESTDKLAHQLKLLKESLESKLAESKEAPPKKPAAPKKPTPKKKDEALRKVNLANPTMSTAQQRAVKYLASGKTIKMAEGKKVHPSSETGLSTLKALEKKGVVKRAVDGTYSLADVFTSGGEIQRSVQEMDSEGYITAHDAEQAVKGWTAHWRYSGNIHVVKDVSQLPGNIAKSLSVKSRKTRGCYIDKTGDIFIVSDNNPTYKKLFENLMHEAFGHHGIRMMPANLINPFLDQIWKDKQDTERMQFINKNYAHVAKAKTTEERISAQRRSAEEWIAHEATKAEEATWKDRLIALVQRWLRSMGIKFKVSDAEIKTWLSNMRQAVVRGDERLWTKHGVSQAVSTENAAVWYSKMTDFLKSKIKGSTDARQLRDTIKTWSDKGEFRTEELEWSGLLDWLTERSGKVSAQEVMDYLDANKVEIVETEKSKFLTVPPEVRKAYRFLSDRGFEQKFSDEGEVLVLSSVTTPNGETLRLYYKNYKDAPVFKALAKDEQDAINTIFKEQDKLDPYFYDSSVLTRHSGYVLDGGKDYTELLLRVPSRESESMNFYHKIHWDEPNVLVHVRFNTRTGPNGEKILLLEEMQSDWHQAGREKGYANIKEQKEYQKVIEKPDVKRAIKLLEKANSRGEVLYDKERRLQNAATNVKAARADIANLAEVIADIASEVEMRKSRGQRTHGTEIELARAKEAMARKRGAYLEARRRYDKKKHEEIKNAISKVGAKAVELSLDLRNVIGKHTSRVNEVLKTYKAEHYSSDKLSVPDA
ncbi:MAG: hypothetical protein WC907_08350, partial [Acholeplasmataceae bacterium]